MMKKFFIGLGVVFLLIILVFIVIGGFGYFKAKKAMPAAENFVETFYEHYNNKNVAYIYNTLSHDKLRQAIKFQAFEEFLKGTVDKLGPVKSKEKGLWRLSSAPDGTYMTIQYKAYRQDSESVDTVILIQNDDSWLLAGYNVNSKDLF
ncbi:MAG: DUF4019 domain-containing protein [Candidatus Aceula meridiana]|nr:DUF4019 domain-containing protein [Candidatus Aceula meridiana]